MRVLLFGTYSREAGYPRTRVLMDSLREVGVEVVECHRPFWRGPRRKVESITGRWGGLGALLVSAPQLLRAWIGLVRAFRRTPPCDLILVGYPGQLDVFLARYLARRWQCPVVLDAFLSLSEALIDDRKLFRPDSIQARFVRWLDGASAKQADLVFLDTGAHIEAFCADYQLKPSLFRRVPVGSDRAVVDALTSDDAPTPLVHADPAVCQVLYCGTFLPFHGVDVVVEALAILTARGTETPPVCATLLGIGPELERIQTLVRERKVSGLTMLSYWAAPEEYAHRFRAADIALGVFGPGTKTARVVPCKIYDALAAGTPVLTAETPAIREFLVPGETVLVCPASDPHALAEALANAAGNKDLRESVGQAGRDLFAARFTPKALGLDLCRTFEELHAEVTGHTAPRSPE